MYKNGKYMLAGHQISKSKIHNITYIGFEKKLVHTSITPRK